MSPGGPKSSLWHRRHRRHRLVQRGRPSEGLVRFDPKAETFQTFPIPSGGGVVRNMDPTPDGKGIVMAMSAQDKVGVAWIE